MEGTQASVESSIGAEGSRCRNDSVSAKAVVYNDSQAPDECLWMLMCVGDMLWNLENYVAGGFYGLQYETLKMD